mmetsp:Transcript_31076/g.54031  ORF Transcript_31076/g.54031 Transcript_31076/m.54031 type:complete len:263 (-) Transcript_31076:1588-2376(-)
MPTNRRTVSSNFMMNRYRLKSPLKVSSPICFDLADKSDLYFNRNIRFANDDLKDLTPHVATTSFDDYNPSSRMTPVNMISVADCVNETPAVHRRVVNRSYQQSMAFYNFKRHHKVHREFKVARPHRIQRSPSALSVNRNVPNSPDALRESQVMFKDFGGDAKILEPGEVEESGRISVTFARNEKDAIAKQILLKNRSPFRISALTPRINRIKLPYPRSPVQAFISSSPVDKGVSMQTSDVDILRAIPIPVVDLKFMDSNHVS